MRMIFEENIEREDFIELIIEDRELDKLVEHRDLVRDFPEGLRGDRNLNVYLRVIEDKN